MDTFSKGLLVAHQTLENGELDRNLQEHYQCYYTGIGKDILSGNVVLEDLEVWIWENGAPTPRSGRQGMLENIVNSYMF
jgi:xylose isomerase